ncbi:MAG: hypothetical protein MJK14_24805 [Rivularia sp. ALOHA_DT_140]|nr:hypothetical protein [Rivularia sp. ALOHA_DT_140]
MRLETILNIFFDNNKAITNEIALEEFKATVRECMYLSLIYIGIIIGILITCIFLLSDIGLFKTCISYMLFRLMMTTLGEKTSRLETKARSLECANSKLEKQYKQICFSWIVKPLPDF